YGIGSESSDLPAFVVLNSAGGLSGGSALYSSGFLPTVYAGTLFRGKGDPIVNVSNPAGVDAPLQRRTPDPVGRLNQRPPRLVGRLNQRHLDVVGDPEIATRISAYEMAYRLQTSAPELMDIAKESKQTLDMYGAKPGESSFANNCLLARRMIERGVRFVTLFH